MSHLKEKAALKESSVLAELSKTLFGHGEANQVKILDTEKRIRGILAGKVLFDTTKAKLVWEHKYFPQYWIPKSSLSNLATFKYDEGISAINLAIVDINVKEKVVPALFVPSSWDSELAGFVKIDFNSLDQWLEEQSQIIYHPKDPFHRIDVLPTSRHIRIEIDGIVLADTKSEGCVMSLWETNLPARWYLPRTAINWEYLIESPTTTGCPYKGEASYYHAVIDGKQYEDVVWWYKFPLLESALIKGMLCFYPDKVDMWVDGHRRDKEADMLARAKKQIEGSG